MATQFVGVSEEPDRGVASGGTGLYEFWTVADEKVYLHDTDFRALTYMPSAGPSLRLVFEYDRDWTPAELRERPFVLFEFHGVREFLCEQDTDGSDGSDVAGQVALFDWDGDDFFSLETYKLRASFRAERSVVTTAAGAGG